MPTLTFVWTCLSSLLVCQGRETSQLKRETPRKLSAVLVGLDVQGPQAPLMQLNTKGQWSLDWPHICPWAGPSTSGSPFISKETFLYLPVCLKCPQIPYDDSKIRAALQAAAEPGVPLPRVLVLSPLPARAGAHPSPFFPQLSSQ